MELVFLGNGSCFYPKKHNTSCYIEFGEDLLLVDCGETVYKRLLDAVDISKKRNIFVVLTHLHADHVGSLGSLLSYCKCVLDKKVYVVHPEANIKDLLRLMGIDSGFYYYLPYLGDEIKGLALKAYKVGHVPNMVCYGYEMSTSDDHIYYSGDSCEIPCEILEKFLAGGIKRFYQDTATHDSPEPTHLFYGHLEKAIPPALRNKVYCMHLDSECGELLRSKGFSIAE